MSLFEQICLVMNRITEELPHSFVGSRDSSVTYKSRRKKHVLMVAKI